MSKNEVCRAARLVLCFCIARGYIFLGAVNNEIYYRGRGTQRNIIMASDGITTN